MQVPSSDHFACIHAVCKASVWGGQAEGLKKTSPSLAWGQPRCDTADVGLRSSWIALVVPFCCAQQPTLLTLPGGRARCETCSGLRVCLGQVRAAWSAVWLWEAASRTSGALQHLKKSLAIQRPLNLQSEESPQTAPQAFLLKLPSPVKEDRNYLPTLCSGEGVLPGNAMQVF